MAEIPIDIGYYESSSLPLAAQNCINHYPQNPQTKGAVSSGALFLTPGIELWRTLGDGPGRGFNIFRNELYVISGTAFYKVAKSGALTALGTIEGTERVITSNNGVTICIQVPGSKGYFYDTDNGLKEITDPVYADFQAQTGGVTSVAYKDGYFIFTTAIEFFLSSLVITNKGQDFDALAFSTAEVKPDDNVVAATIKNELYVAGTDSIELFQNTGADFPYQRINGATVDKGVAARHTFIEFDNSFVFVGGGLNESLAIWRGLAGSVSKISTAAIDHAIQKYTQDEISSAYAWTYTQDGNFFVGFSFPDTTFVYDATVSALQGRAVWHERRSNDSVWRANHIIDVYGENYVLDNDSGSVGKLKRTVRTEYNNPISREFTGVSLYNMGKPFKLHYIELKTESGSGLPLWTTKEPEDLDPQVELLVSGDGGRSFNSYGNRSLGTYQDYTARQVWQRGGRYEDTAVLRFKTSGKAGANYTNLQVNIVGGR